MKADELVNEIYAIIRVLQEQDISGLSGDTLSRLAVKLASYKASLGEYVSQAKRQVYNTEAAYQVARAESYAALRDEGKGTTDASELWRLGTQDQLAALNEAKEQSDRITTLSMDCHDLIDGIKSRLINLQNERTESNVF